MKKQLFITWKIFYILLKVVAFNFIKTKLIYNLSNPNPEEL